MRQSALQQGNAVPASFGTLHGRSHVSATIAPKPPDAVLAALADRAVERVVLGRVLAAHPRHLTLADLVERYGERFGATAVERALTTLVEACLLVREGGAFVPAPAVVRIVS